MGGGVEPASLFSSFISYGLAVLMKLLDTLQHEPITSLDLSYYITVATDTPVREVVQALRQSKRNCALVLRDEQLVGIFTDRDVLRKVVDHPEIWDRPIETVMTPNPEALDEKATAAEALALMKRLHVRNVPVVRSSGEVVGNFTPYAIVRFLADTFPVTIYNRPPDPKRVPRREYGG
jgi:CBS domain-containing protein